MAAAPSPVRIALLTPPGRGALAVVGVVGPGAVELVARLFTARGGQPLADRPDGSIVFGRWADPERGEDVIVVLDAADRLEVHCHGGLAASVAVIRSLESLGAVRQPWGEWLEGDSDAIAREAREALARAAGPKAARILCRQLAGALAAELDRIGSLQVAGDTAAAGAAVQRLVRASRVGLRLTRPWRVVVTGPVNAGKSSLVNALAGYSRSIVSAEPGTTRDVVETRLVLDGWEIDLVDTAGLREAAAATSATERAGIERAMATAAEADLVVHVAASPGPAGGFPGAGKRPGLLVASKSDLASVTAAPPGVIRTSAHTGEGLATLADAIVRMLVPEAVAALSLLAGPVPFTSRQMALLDALNQPR
jgi:tRNA modification GTPase